MEQSMTIDFAGRPLTIETGRMAKQADGAAVVRYGDTIMLVTACADRDPREGADFLPLRVDFEEKMYAVGRIPGGFFKREGRPTEEATRTMGIMDKALRPLFPRGLRNDVQVIATALSADEQNSPDIACVIGASAALGTSPIPFDGPVAAAEVGRKDGELILNPSYAEIEEGGLHVVVMGNRRGIISVEIAANAVPDEIVADAIEMGHAALPPVLDMLDEFARKAGKPKSDEFFIWQLNEEVHEAVVQAAEEDMRAALETVDKQEQRERLKGVRDRVMGEMMERYPDNTLDVFESLELLEAQLVERMILTENRRPDGRGFGDLRELSSVVGLLPRAHGSGLFTRGETQVLTVATLGAVRDQKLVRSLADPEDYKSFMHQYNFPPYSTGEARPLRAPSRREIKHGILAETALKRMIPGAEEFPYTIRLVTEVLGSNSSSSMASVCGSTLALMDAGVPIREPVAGVGMGLITAGDRNIILTDIQYVEDAGGHMDFKVAGTREGVTAAHLDIKKPGIDASLLREALVKAREARNKVLDNMLATIPAPRAELSPYAPRIFVIHVDKEKIGLVIGPGGKTIRRIEEECDVDVDVEDDGGVFITAHNGEGGEKARKYIEDLTREIRVGDIFTGRVISTKPQLGAFVEIVPGKDGLVHISELEHGHVDKTEDVLRVGDEVQVKVIEVDEGNGRIRLSRRALLPPDSSHASRQAEGSRPHGEGGRGGRPDRGHDSRGRDSSRRPPQARGEERSQPEGEPRAYFREKRRR